MGMPSRDEIGLILYNYAYVRSIKENEEKPPESKVVFQIPIAIANKGMEQTFTGDKSQDRKSVV